MTDQLRYKLKHARIKKGLTLSEVAQAVNCSPAYISRIEGGSRQKINYQLYTELTKLYGIEDELEGAGKKQGNEDIAEIRWALVNIQAKLGQLRSAVDEAIYLAQRTDIE